MQRRLGYVPELDGLRGLAVLAILVYHGWADSPSGGFLGVDLFFVVSGYLITALLLEERVDRGEIDLLGFYGRRIRRLLPALLVVIGAVLVFGALYSSAAQADVIRRDALGGLFYVHNWVQVASSDSYFSDFGTPSPLRHLWTLAIEEQWYVVWPLVVIGATRRSRNPARVVAVVSGTLFVASAVWMIVLEQQGATIDRMYYGTDSRLQTVAIGAILATIPATFYERRLVTLATPFVGCLSAGGVLVLYFAVSGTDRRVYQGGFTLFAVMGVFLIATVTRVAPLSAVFAARPLVWVGKVSYSLYLWHWPFFIGLNPDSTGIDGPALFAVRVAASFAAATITYAFVEQPVRRQQVTIRLTAFTMAGVAVLAVLSFTALSTFQPAEVAADDFGAPLSARDPEPQPTTSADGGAAPATEREKPNVLVLGDSITHSFSIFVDVAPLGADFHQLNGGLIGCGLFDAPEAVGAGITEGWNGCDRRFDFWDDLMTETDPATVLIVTGGWEMFDRQIGDTIAVAGSPEWQHGIEESFDRVLTSARAHGANVLLGNVPCFEMPDLGLGNNHASVRNDRERTALLNDEFESIAAGHDDVEIVDFEGIVCPDGQPVEELAGVTLREDGVHYTTKGAIELWRLIIPQVNAAVAESVDAASAAERSVAATCEADGRSFSATATVGPSKLTIESIDVDGTPESSDEAWTVISAPPGAGERTWTTAPTAALIGVSFRSRTLSLHSPDGACVLRLAAAADSSVWIIGDSIVSDADLLFDNPPANRAEGPRSWTFVGESGAGWLSAPGAPTSGPIGEIRGADDAEVMVMNLGTNDAITAALAGDGEAASWRSRTDSALTDSVELAESEAACVVLVTPPTEASDLFDLGAGYGTEAERVAEEIRTLSSTGALIADWAEHSRDHHDDRVGDDWFIDGDEVHLTAAGTDAWLALIEETVADCSAR